jgi:cytochrome c oxidase cbb3-type subunit I/II
VNGLLTLRGVWDKVRDEPVLRFMAAALTFYAMSTFEGPLLSVKSVNALGHYTDWIIGHVHGGTLGWNSFLTFGMIYYLVPKLWNTELHSKKLANIQFWMGMAGIALYVVAMWAAGITQGLMLQQVDLRGKLVYHDFVATVVRIVPLYWVRAVGGTLFLGSIFILVYNVVKTVAKAKAAEPEVPVVKRVEHFDDGIPLPRHHRLEGLPAIFTILAIGAILVGSIIEILPALTLHEYASVEGKETLEAGAKLYQAKCATCHLADGGGQVGPNLTDNFWINGDGKMPALMKVIQDGVPDKGMPVWGDTLEADEILSLSAFVRSLHGTTPGNPKAPQGAEVIEPKQP